MQILCKMVITKHCDANANLKIENVVIQNFLSKLRQSLRRSDRVATRQINSTPSLIWRSGVHRRIILGRLVEPRKSKLKMAECFYSQTSQMSHICPHHLYSPSVAQHTLDTRQDTSYALDTRQDIK